MKKKHCSEGILRKWYGAGIKTHKVKFKITFTQQENKSPTNATLTDLLKLKTQSLEIYRDCS